MNHGEWGGQIDNASALASNNYWHLNDVQPET